MLTSYLENEVFSATPQKLRLMLVDGALRFARQTSEHWQREEMDAGSRALARCREIVVELISSVRTGREACEAIIDQSQGKPRLQQRERDIDSLLQITSKTAAIYLVILRELNEAQLHSDSAKIEGAIRVLAVERETLRLVCEQLPHVQPMSTPHRSAEITSTQAASVLAASADKAAGGPMIYGDSPRPKASLSLDG